MEVQRLQAVCQIENEDDDENENDSLAFMAT
jgi:hypothetical protein